MLIMVVCFVSQCYFGVDYNCIIFVCSITAKLAHWR